MSLTTYKIIWKLSYQLKLGLHLRRFLWLSWQFQGLLPCLELPAGTLPTFEWSSTRLQEACITFETQMFLSYIRYNATEACLCYPCQLLEYGHWMPGLHQTPLINIVIIVLIQGSQFCVIFIDYISWCTIFHNSQYFKLEDVLVRSSMSIETLKRWCFNIYGVGYFWSNTLCTSVLSIFLIMKLSEMK